MPLLSHYARKKKIDFFFDQIPKAASILEIGSGSGWVKHHFTQNGYSNYTGIDVTPPADIVGDILRYRDLGLTPNSIDYIVAFEVVEHVDCFKACYDLLKPGGRLLLTTPFPPMDWFLKILEMIGLNQRRTSPHNNLVYLSRVDQFDKKEIKLRAFLSQWSIFTK